MSKAVAVLSALIFLSQPVLPGSISLDSSFVVQSSTSMTPNSSDSFSSRYIQIYDQTQTPSPISFMLSPEQITRWQSCWITEDAPITFG